jgi:hypothetical protein
LDSLRGWGTLAAGVFRRFVEQGEAQALAAGESRDEKARDRPDRLVIDWLERSRLGEPRLMFARCKGAPSRRFATRVSKQTWDFT